MAGDVDVDRAIAEVAATFGTLPPRAQGQAAKGEMRFPLPDGTGPVTLFHKGRDDQAMGFVAWPTIGYSAQSRQLARTLTLLGAVFQLRLTDELREREGVSYAPGAAHGASATWEKYGYLAAQVEAPPGKLDSFFAAAQRIADELSSKPVDPDELNRARLPMLESIERARDGNGFWLNALEDLGSDPFTLESIRTQRSDLEGVTPAALQAAAKQYLLAPRAMKIRVVKGGPAGTATPPRTAGKD
jgi:zinc protease